MEQLRSRSREERHQALMSLLATARSGLEMRNAIMQVGLFFDENHPRKWPEKKNKAESPATNL